ncbi:MAG: S8 family serine peptidase [Desulfobacteraceae bacterium]|nr:S8 family serine peptidase [Desulfobacteraceae bacterium]
MTHTKSLFLLIIVFTAIFYIGSGIKVNAQDVRDSIDPKSSSPTLTGNTSSKGSPYTKSRVLIKLKPDVETRKLSGNRESVADERLADELGTRGITQLMRLFPKAVAPRKGDVVSLSEGRMVPKPDLTLWYAAELPAGADVLKVATELSKSEKILMAEPDYIWKLNDSPNRPERVGGKEKAVAGSRSLQLPGPTTDPLFSDSWHLTAAKVTDAWSHLQGLGLEPGGDRGIVVAVIDTGVDYNHPDLDANIWTNTQEIPNNGIDDDNNGYVDDVHGVNVINDTGDPMDSNGHGTHVAGIIAAEANNGIGGVGVAYNVQIMGVVAAQYSGVLASSDIAEAVQYAVAKNANVINMSFGGYSESQVVKDALTVAYASAVLVASAGNAGIPNESTCNPISYGPMYPAAYPWILGVMARRQSAAANGDYLAFFSNWDCIAQNPIEYELMAPGVDIWSTLPSTQYAAWDGTSMAAPVISGIAALVRTKFSNTNDYTTRFIMGQIAATGVTRQGITSESTVKSFHDADALAALTDTPQPQLSYAKNYIFDTTSVDLGNDADGEVDSGETVDLGIIIRNHWGKAQNVSATLAAWASGAVSPDPYVTMNIATVDYGAIGSFNEDDNGITYDASGTPTGVQYPFRFTVDASTPNNHIIPFRLTTTCKNGLNSSDTTTYTSTSYFNITVQRGTNVSGEITENTTWTSDKLWIVTGNVLVPIGVTLTVEPGTKVAFEDDKQLIVRGTLNAAGTKDNRITFTSNSLAINPRWGGIRLFDYANMSLSHCDFSYGTYGINIGELSREVNNTVAVNESTFLFCTYPFVNTNNSQATMTVARNIFKNCSSGIQFWMSNTEPSHLISKNVFCSISDSCYDCVPLYIASGKIWENTQIDKNSFCNNFSYDVYTSYPSGYPGEEAYTINMENNYWGTTSTSEISSKIFDYYDDFSRAKVDFEPYLTQPSPDAPAQIVSLSTNPSGQLGVGEVEFTLTFNCDMDTTTEALVAFGPADPYTDHQITGNWQGARTWTGPSPSRP